MPLRSQYCFLFVCLFVFVSWWRSHRWPATATHAYSTLQPRSGNIIIWRKAKGRSDEYIIKVSPTRSGTTWRRCEDVFGHFGFFTWKQQGISAPIQIFARRFAAKARPFFCFYAHICSQMGPTTSADTPPEQYRLHSRMTAVSSSTVFARRDASK